MNVHKSIQFLPNWLMWHAYDNKAQETNKGEINDKTKWPTNQPMDGHREVILPKTIARSYQEAKQLSYWAHIHTYKKADIDLTDGCTDLQAAIKQSVEFTSCIKEHF